MAAVVLLMIMAMFNNGIGNKNMKMKHILYSLKRKYKGFFLTRLRFRLSGMKQRNPGTFHTTKEKWNLPETGNAPKRWTPSWMNRYATFLPCCPLREILAFLSVSKKHYFTKAMMFETLSPLTFKDDEFDDEYGGDALQNKRDSSVFKDKDSGRIYDIDAFRHRQVFSYNIDTDEMKTGNGLTWSGSIMVYDDMHGKGWFGVSNGYIDPKNKNFTADNQTVVPTIEIIDNTCDRGSFIMSITCLSAFPKAFFKDYTLIASDKEWAKKDTDFIMSNRRLEVKLLKALEKLPKEESHE